MKTAQADARPGWSRELAGVDAELLHPREERRAIDAQALRCTVGARNAPFALGEDSDDLVSTTLPRIANGRDWRRWIHGAHAVLDDAHDLISIQGPFVVRAVVDWAIQAAKSNFKRFASGQNHGPFDDVL
jgi:hypothetical protein